MTLGNGSQGQDLHLVPDYALIVVLTAAIRDGDIFPEALTRNYVLPAIP